MLLYNLAQNLNLISVLQFLIINNVAQLSFLSYNQYILISIKNMFFNHKSIRMLKSQTQEEVFEAEKVIFMLKYISIVLPIQIQFYRYIKTKLRSIWTRSISIYPNYEDYHMVKFTKLNYVTGVIYDPCFHLNKK